MIHLLRHGETHWNRAGRLQGQKDSPLTLRGIEQARRNGERLRAFVGDLEGYQMICSPLGRAWQTATIVAETLGLESRVISLEPRLMEIHFGVWEGLTLAEIQARDPEEWRSRLGDKWHHRVPGGESYALVAERARTWLSEQAPDERKIVVSHGLIGRILRGLYAALNEAETIAQSEAHGSFWRLTSGVVQEFDDPDSPP